ncbi:unnamed protein product [Vitrella brassicaformis CCMP3155]|uniref:Uncharacterized protein n=1 Tax=Vitrella brassicaformis (strain CCMP3155) TaxID=1169540 RepID=A0A0G4G995_VITBC|nr:unnamed protein product [Vitrella brassicaformis CCMP3155]|eukprot:CEM25240.1 unnamed protein product [Vitrella brassicaformis CCMP3155]
MSFFGVSALLLAHVVPLHGLQLPSAVRDPIHQQHQHGNEHGREWEAALNTSHHVHDLSGQIADLRSEIEAIGRLRAQEESSYEHLMSNLRTQQRALERMNETHQQQRANQAENCDDERLDLCHTLGLYLADSTHGDDRLMELTRTCVKFVSLGRRVDAERSASAAAAAAVAAARDGPVANGMEETKRQLERLKEEKGRELQRYIDEKQQQVSAMEGGIRRLQRQVWNNTDQLAADKAKCTHDVQQQFCQHYLAAKGGGLEGLQRLFDEQCSVHQDTD